ncbi:MAG: endonuclease/exonuclease/phosphatase family protein [Chloroflexi bacterium]|nr:endonuclease/exonuclease/phosphatase family protein [Chloroflexota bacterium]
MKLLTYNIHGWRTTDGRPNLGAIRKVIEASQADIIGLNEVYYPRVVAGAEDPALGVPALDVLAQQLGMYYVFGPCLRWPAQDDMPADAYGNALLSRWPIIANAAHHLTPKEEDGHNILADKEVRGLLEARILLPNNDTFTVYVTHLDHTDEEARLVQLRVARTWLTRDRNRPHVVMGDFNALSLWDFVGRQSEFEALTQHPKGKNSTAGEKGPRVIAQMEKAGYVDTYQHFGTPGQRSFLPSEQPIRIDYIFASQSLLPAVKACVIWPEPAGQEASDHRPILAEIHYPL